MTDSKIPATVEPWLAVRDVLDPRSLSAVMTAISLCRASGVLGVTASLNSLSQTYLTDPHRLRILVKGKQNAVALSSLDLPDDARRALELAVLSLVEDDHMSEALAELGFIEANYHEPIGITAAITEHATIVSFDSIGAYVIGCHKQIQAKPGAHRHRRSLCSVFFHSPQSHHQVLRAATEVPEIMKDWKASNRSHLQALPDFNVAIGEVTSQSILDLLSPAQAS